MGHRKIEIKAIIDDGNRSVTLLKRKAVFSKRLMSFLSDITVSFLAATKSCTSLHLVMSTKQFVINTMVRPTITPAKEEPLATGVCASSARFGSVWAKANLLAYEDEYLCQHDSYSTNDSMGESSSQSQNRKLFNSP